MPNMKSLINSHNKGLLKPQPNQDPERSCNCINKDGCPLNNNCLSTSLIYEATVTTNLPNQREKKYIGLTEPTFKKRFSGHKTSFNLERYRHSTTLSTEVWRLKELNGDPKVTWRKIRNARAYNPESNKCFLCLNEKFEIANYPNDNLLNKQTEIIAKCRHRRKFELLLQKNDDEIT